MRPRPPAPGRGILSGTGLIITGLTATLAALIFPVWSYADRGGTGEALLNAETVATEYGPLSGLDRDFLTKVRLAGLWELPAGEQARLKGHTAAVQKAVNGPFSSPSGWTVGGMNSSSLFIPPRAVGAPARLGTCEAEKLLPPLKPVLFR